MPAWVIPAIAAVGSVVGSLISANSQRATNQANAANVDKQLDFQREQSRTEWQRAVADISSAGLNPALAYGKGGNSSQSGAAAENRNLFPDGAAQLNRAVEAYNQFANGTAQRQLLREQTNVAAQQARAIAIGASAQQPDALLGQDKDYMQSRREGAKRDIYTNRMGKDKFDIELAATRQSTGTAAAQEKLLRTQSTLNEQEFTNEWFRKNVQPYLNSTARVRRAIIGGRF